MNRREAIEALTLGGAALPFSSLVMAEVDAQAQTPAAAAPAATPVPSNIIKAFAGQRTPKPLTFDPAKLKGLSEKLIRSHHENNYTGSVKALNAVELRLAALMQEKDIPPFIYGDVKREEMIRTGSVILHDHYFANLGGDGKSAEDILFAIRQTWGSYEVWEAEYKRTAMALAGGPGWSILAFNFHTGELHNYWCYDHMHNAPVSRPLLVCDMYEHAFHIDFGAAAAKYVDAFMMNVNWEEVNRRFQMAQKAAPFLRG